MANRPSWISGQAAEDVQLKEEKYEAEEKMLADEAKENQQQESREGEQEEAGQLERKQGAGCGIRAICISVMQLQG